jgi:hypothetical protein
LREKRRLRAFENRVLRNIFGPSRDEVAVESRRLHNEELNDLYCSPNTLQIIKSRRRRWTGYVARMGEERRIQGFGVGNLRKKPLGRTRIRWEYNIKMDLQVV